MTRTRGRRGAPAERPAAQAVPAKQPAPPKQSAPPEQPAPPEQSAPPEDAVPERPERPEEPEEPERPAPDGPAQPPEQPVRTPTRLRRARRPQAGEARYARRTRRLPAWWPLPVCASLGAIAGGGYGVLKAPQYTATSYVLAVPENRSDSARALGFAQAYGRVATQVAALGDAPVWAGVPESALRGNVRAETSPDAPMIAITATSSHAGRTADMANAVSRTLITHANRNRRDTEVRLIQFSRAVDPVAPTSASAPVTALVGGCAGGLLGGLALLARPRRLTEGPVPHAAAGPAAACPGPDPHASAGRATGCPTDPTGDHESGRGTDPAADHAVDLEGSRR